ncbi:MAG: SHOCT domain-containing protein [Acidobacteriia bacterium]|nr:SHOCT domain-containing protein [Terriglobia bacterium]
MKKLGAPVIAVVVLLSICGAGCSRGEKSRELSALDKAYQAGVLTKDEYEVKKAAFESAAAAQAALNKALEAGVLTKDEYDARKTRLSAQIATLEALERAMRGGVLSKSEYLTKKAALLAPETTTPPSQVARVNSSPTPVRTAVANQPAATEDSGKAAAATIPPSPAGQSNAYRMKLVKIMDQSGFERPMPSSSLLIPTDWESQGATQWYIKDNCNTIQSYFRATGPDGRGFEVFPEYNWAWADDPTFLKTNFAQKAQMGAHACDVMPPMGAADYIRRNIARIRPNAQITAIEPMRKLMQDALQQARKTEQMAAQYGLRQSVRPDIVRARLKYSLKGQPVEEWLIVRTMVTGTLAPSYNVARAAMTQAFTYNCNAVMIAERAPQGRLDSSEKFFELLLSTIRINPEWQRRITANAQTIQQIELKGVRDRSAIVSKNAEDIRNIQKQGYENQQRSEDHIFAQFSENTRGIETYRNPSTGETVELSNQYGHAWVNNRGEYLLSDQEGFDPNVTFKEDWTPLVHVKP